MKMGRRPRCSSVTYRLDMRPPGALPAAHFDRNERYAYFGDRTLKKRSLMSITNHWERRFFGAIERGEPSFELYRVGK